MDQNWSITESCSSYHIEIIGNEKIGTPYNWLGNLSAKSRPTVGGGELFFTFTYSIRSMQIQLRINNVNKR